MMRKSINMEQFNSYCTVEQTKRALALGAPIETCEYADMHNSDADFIDVDDWFHDETTCYRIPTIEQMVNWIENVKPLFRLSVTWNYSKDRVKWFFYINSTGDNKKYKTKKEAYIACIDAMLGQIEHSNEVLGKK